MRIAATVLVCAISFGGVGHASSLDDLANQVTVLDTYQQTAEPNINSQPMKKSKLSTYAYDVGLDVSKLTPGQVSEIESSFKGKPSWAFCDEHRVVEIVMNGSSIWERTTVMKLQRYSDISIVH
ncbi:hypothetical protein OQJ65_22380 [Vibrio sp. Sgm 22]|uniref:hypothetical protein n=1 Tax=unclassified Vibrio TaxID=2614977 RepID=UPI002248DC2B|nr:MULTISPECIES: hypothetical protein [unclassified Vibrio]MCX2761126.1 hypothetical protein [Vibrio sp. 14G-20]MCX2778056.1 hypothetical protein [Vibrio sp. Sgm 22]